MVERAEALLGELDIPEYDSDGIPMIPPNDRTWYQDAKIACQPLWSPVL